MKRLPYSRRRRRRLMWLTGTAAVAAGATVLGLFYANTGEVPQSASNGPSRPIIVPHQEKTVPVGPHLKEIEAVAAKFVATAVVRRNLDQSYDLVAPQLREGMSRATWREGAIPVVPYQPASDLSFTKMSVTYSYAKRVGLIIGMFPKAHAKTPYEAFSMELTAYKRGTKYRWLIDSWAPAGIGIGNPAGAPVSNVKVGQTRQTLSRIWILLPIVFLLSMIVLIPAGLIFRGWRRDRHARRRVLNLP